MKSCLCTSVLIIIFVGSFFSQANKSSDCPAISVSAPSGIPQKGELITFTAAVEKGKLKGLKYFWTVSQGKILSGQGSLTISVSTRKEWWIRSDTTATLKVIGLPRGCPSEESETFGVSDESEYQLVEGYEDITLAEEKERLAKIDITPIKKSTYGIHFFIQATDEQKFDAAKNRELKIKKFLVEKLKIPMGQILFTIVESNVDLTKVFIVSGAQLSNEK